MEEYKIQAKGYAVTSIYIGGGTPSLLTEAQMKQLMKTVKRCFYVTPKCEISAEVNPGTADRRKLRAFHRAGINRLSIGAQSFDDNELSVCGRIHSANEVYEAVTLAKKARFNNINLDIMYGLPGQSKRSLLTSIKNAIELNVEHISLYGLKLEQGTPFWEERNSLDLPDEDRERDMYFSAIDLMRYAGLRQYEISNFAKKGYACKHNLRYWNCDEYLGFGPAAHSYFGGKRFSFKKDLALYMDSFDPEKHVRKSIIDEYIDIPASARVAEYVMLRFRLSAGINCEKFKARFGRRFEDLYYDKMLPFLKSGHIVKTTKGYAFTPEGMYVSNYILARIVDFDLVIPGIDN